MNWLKVVTLTPSGNSLVETFGALAAPSETAILLPVPRQSRFWCSRTYVYHPPSGLSAYVDTHRIYLNDEASENRLPLPSVVLPLEMKGALRLRFSIAAGPSIRVIVASQSGEEFVANITAGSSLDTGGLGPDCATGLAVDSGPAAIQPSPDFLARAKAASGDLWLAAYNGDEENQKGTLLQVYDSDSRLLRQEQLRGCGPVTAVYAW